MPFKSKAQQRFMFAAEARGDLPSGTAKRWAKHTKDISKLPERKKESADKAPSRWEGAVRGSGGGLATAGLLGGTALGTLMAAKHLKRGNIAQAGKTIAGVGGAGWMGGALAGAAKGALKPKTAQDIAVAAGARHALRLLVE